MRQAILIPSAEVWVRYRGGWLPVNRLARSREELEEFGRSLDQAMRQGLGLAFWGEKALRAKGELLLVCIECGAAPAEVQGRCLQCARRPGGISLDACRRCPGPERLAEPQPADGAAA